MVTHEISKIQPAVMALIEAGRDFALPVSILVEDHPLLFTEYKDMWYYLKLKTERTYVYER